MKHKRKTFFTEHSAKYDFELCFTDFIFVSHFYTSINGSFGGVERRDRHRSNGLCELFRSAVVLNNNVVVRNRKSSGQTSRIEDHPNLCFKLVSPGEMMCFRGISPGEIHFKHKLVKYKLKAFFTEI